MKTNLSIFTTGIAIAGAAIFAGCSDSGSNNTLTPIELSRAEEEVCTDLNTFSANLLKAAVDNSEGKNVAVSPLGAAMVAGMFGNAIAVNERSELAAALSVDGTDFSELNSYNAKMLVTLPKLDKATKVILANGSWFDRDAVQLSDQYRSILENDYDSEIKMADFNSGSTLSEINGWVAKRTDNAVPKILRELNPQDVAVWINTLYFKGLWKYKFNKGNTKKDYFFLADGTRTSVDMMKGDERVISFLSYERINGYDGDIFSADADFDNILVTTFCSMDYGNSGFAFGAVMPDERTTIQEYVAENKDILFKWLSDKNLLGKEQVDASLYFPRLSLSSETDLIPLMQTLGVKTIFDTYQGVKMPGLGITDFNKAIGTFKQSIKFDVDEEGATIKVATLGKGQLGAYAPPVTAKFNHPFIYFIWEKSTGTILLAGTVMNPNE